METNDSDPTADAPSDRHHDSGVPVHPSGLEGFESVEVTTDVHIPEEYAVAVAYRLGIRIAQGGDVTRFNAEEMALDYTLRHDPLKISCRTTRCLYEQEPLARGHADA